MGSILQPSSARQDTKATKESRATLQDIYKAHLADTSNPNPYVSGDLMSQIEIYLGVKEAPQDKGKGKREPPEAKPAAKRAKTK